MEPNAPAAVPEPPVPSPQRVQLLPWLIMLVFAIATVFLGIQNWQMQHELNSYRRRPTPTPTESPRPTVAPTAAEAVPAPVTTVFTAVNEAFNTAIVPTKETTFYSKNGFVNRESWKLLLSDVLTDNTKLLTLYNTLESYMKQDLESAADGMGQSVQGYENDSVYCYLLRGFNASDYLSCVEK